MSLKAQQRHWRRNIVTIVNSFWREPWFILKSFNDYMTLRESMYSLKYERHNTPIQRHGIVPTLMKRCINGIIPFGMYSKIPLYRPLVNKTTPQLRKAFASPKRVFYKAPDKRATCKMFFLFLWWGASNEYHNIFCRKYKEAPLRSQELKWASKIPSAT